VVDAYVDFLMKARNNADGAESFLRKMVQDNPEDTSLLEDLGVFMMDVRTNYAASEELYQRAVGQNPVGYSVWMGGQTLWQAGLKANFSANYDEAERLFRSEMKAEPDWSEPPYRLAIFLELKRKNYSEASQFFQSALKKFPGNLKLTEGYARLKEEHPEYTR
jgi:tetratricopeptide (TPR) repeat protein